MGRGVTDQSAELYMLNHQNIFAQVAEASRRRAVSQSFSPAINWFDWRQNITCARSRKKLPPARQPGNNKILAGAAVGSGYNHDRRFNSLS